MPQRPDTKEASNWEEARACPSLGFVEDCRHEGHWHQGLPFMNTPIALPSKSTNQTKVSKPFRRVLATDFLAEHHHVARDVGRSGASWGRRICVRVRNHVSRLKTQSTSRWSRVLTSCAQIAQVSESFKPWWWSLSEVQHRPCSTNQAKSLHLPDI
jgi:hypothetical protein